MEQWLGVRLMLSNERLVRISLLFALLLVYCDLISACVK